MNNSPVIIMGMHRSGTTLVAKILQQSGVFLGKKLDINLESVYFQKINKWLLSVAGASWDNPEGFKVLLQSDDILSVVRNRIDLQLKSPFAYQYLGITKYLSVRSVLNQNYQWGWKDPRNTITLPVWMKLFPDSRVIYLTRHGVDVAYSLYNREKKIILKGRNGQLKHLHQIMAPVMPIVRGSIISSAVCQSFDRCFDLWLKYMEIGKIHLNQFQKCVLTIKYEDLLNNPVNNMTRIADHLDMNISSDKIKKLDLIINKNRAYAYLTNTELKKFAKQNTGKLSDFGY